ncbi:hypothetical protein C1645_676081, partial [Glomus cerebriforme]
MLFFEIGLPLALYFILKNFMSEVNALIISGVPPFLVVIYGLIRKRRVDILGILIILSFIVGAIVAALKSDPRIYLLRESTITGTIGLAFLITLIPIKIGSFQLKPMVFYFAKDMATGGSFSYSTTKSELPGLTDDEPVSERWDRYWVSYPTFRHGFIVMTVFWGVGLIAEVPIRVIIVYRMPIDRAIYLSNIV